jgi:hypothetical protein
MKPLGTRQLSVLLIGTLLFCHGVFGALHLICPPQCASDAGHAAEHQAAATGGAHEHPADHGTSHGTSTGYFAVLAVGLLGLLLGLLPKGAQLRLGLASRWSAVLNRVSAVLGPPPTPTPRTLQVFRL